MRNVRRIKSLLYIKMKNLEIKTIVHKEVSVRIRIDYDAGTASLLDCENNKKHWVFAERGLEYMQGWLNVVEAMSEAVKQCKKDLELNLAEKSRFKTIASERAQNIIENHLMNDKINKKAKKIFRKKI